MKEYPTQPKEVSISEKISGNLKLEKLIEYHQLKTNIMELLTGGGIWSEEFSAWMDENLEFFGGLGKCIEALGMWKSRRKTKQNLEEASRYRGMIESSLKKSNNPCQELFLNWIDSADYDLLEKLGELMDYASNIYLDYTTEIMVKSKEVLR